MRKISKIGAFLLFALAAVSFYFLLKPKMPGKNLHRPLPLKYWDGCGNTPLVFYISGDAGFNNFSTYFSDALHQKGYDVFALDTKAYFWKPRTAEGAAQDFSRFLENIFAHRKNQKLVIMGYSFGADALPFILEKIPQKTRQRIIKVILADPSVKGDLEINIADYLRDDSGKWYTIPQLNQQKNISLAVILSDFSAKRYPYRQITLPDKTLYRLRGNHRFNNDYSALANTVVKSFSK